MADRVGACGGGGGGGRESGGGRGLGRSFEEIRQLAFEQLGSGG